MGKIAAGDPKTVIKRFIERFIWPLKSDTVMINSECVRMRFGKR